MSMLNSPPFAQPHIAPLKHHQDASPIALQCHSCRWHTEWLGRRNLRMAGHSEQAYFAYLPETIFSPSSTHHLSLHPFAARNEDVERSTKSRDELKQPLGDVEMSGGLDSSSVDSCRTTLLWSLNNDRQRHRDGASGHLAAARANEPATIMSLTTTLTETQQPDQNQVTVEQRLPPEQAELAMQMVVRSQQSPSTVPDAVARPSSHISQAMFNALVASAQTIEEDALVVNHPCRMYDVAHFLNIWSIDRFLNSTCMPIKVNAPGELKSLDQERYYSRLHNDMHDDPQGIPWSGLGTTQQYAFEARKLLQPYAHGSQPRTSGVSEQCLQERFYRFQSFHARHRARYGHYQLRNMLSAPSPVSVFYAAGTEVKCASLAFPHQTASSLDLSKSANAAFPFQITCLSSVDAEVWPSYHSDPIVLAGGFNGEFAMMRPYADQEPIHGQVSHEYNGLVTHITTQRHYRSGVLQATFSSNDCHIRTMDIETQCLVSDHKHCTSINATATSPDGRLRIVVGDNCEPVITDAERGSTLVPLSAHTGYVFACAWSPDSRLAATAAQDGRTIFWDTRNWSQPLEILSSDMSCVRSLNFTSDGLLVMAENEDIVSIWNPTTRRRQDLRMFGSIAGVALLDGGAEIVVANADRTVGGLMVFDRNRASFLDGHDRSACMPDAVQDLVV